jgi:hypothetical protein
MVALLVGTPLVSPVCRKTQADRQSSREAAGHHEDHYRGDEAPGLMISTVARQPMERAHGLVRWPFVAVLFFMTIPGLAVSLVALAALRTPASISPGSQS